MAGGSGEATLAQDGLRGCRLFAEVDDATLYTIAAALRPRRFRRGEVVFHAGDPGDALFIVVSGQAKVIVPSDDGSEPAILATLGPGGFFGELALLDGAARSTTIVAIDVGRDHGPAARCVRPAGRHGTRPAAGAARVARRRDPPADRPKSRTSISSTCRAGSPDTCFGRSRPPMAVRPTTRPTSVASAGCPGRSPRRSWPA